MRTTNSSVAHAYCHVLPSVNKVNTIIKPPLRNLKFRFRLKVITMHSARNQERI
jgi:hypothetical protein